MARGRTPTRKAPAAAAASKSPAPKAKAAKASASPAPTKRAASRPRAASKAPKAENGEIKQVTPAKKTVSTRSGSPKDGEFQHLIQSVQHATGMDEETTPLVLGALGYVVYTAGGFHFLPKGLEALLKMSPVLALLWNNRDQLKVPSAKKITVDPFIKAVATYTAVTTALSLDKALLTMKPVDFLGGTIGHLVQPVWGFVTRFTNPIQAIIHTEQNINFVSVLAALYLLYAVVFSKSAPARLHGVFLAVAALSVIALQVFSSPNGLNDVKSYYMPHGGDLATDILSALKHIANSGVAVVSLARGIEYMKKKKVINDSPAVCLAVSSILSCCALTKMWAPQADKVIALVFAPHLMPELRQTIVSWVAAWLLFRSA